MGFPKFDGDFPEGKYTMSEAKMSISGDNFSIKDEDGENVLESNAALFTIGDSFTAKCPKTDEDVFTMKKTLIALHSQFYIMPGSGGEVLATIQKNFVSMHDTVCIYAGEDTSATPLMTCKGNMLTGWDRTFYKGDGDEVIASSHSEQCNFMANLCGTNTYDVEIQDSACAVLVFATMMAIDEMKEDSDEDSDDG